MDDQNTNPSGTWAFDMGKAQSNMMQQWTEANTAWLKVLGGAGGAKPGAAFMGLGMPGGAGADMGAQLVGQFEHYMGVTRSLWELLGKSASVSDPAQRLRVFNDGLTALQSQFSSLFAPPMFAPTAGMMPSMMSPMMGNPWQAAAAAFGMAPGGAPGAMFGMPPGMANPFAGAGNFNPAEWLQWPALGPAREQQESWQKLAATVARCAQAQGKLATLWNEIIAAGLKELGGKLSPKLQSGAMPGSMKELYDSWVESAESAYKSAAHGAAFMQAQAELSNAMSALRVAQRETLEEWGKQFDLPTRAEINSLHQQVKQLTDALRKLGG
jgi:class III poly(R)-hydroxyalkanoic acid synthase PhaE subunit